MGSEVLVYGGLGDGGFPLGDTFLLRILETEVRGTTQGRNGPCSMDSSSFFTIFPTDCFGLFCQSMWLLEQVSQSWLAASALPMLLEVKAAHANLMEASPILSSALLLNRRRSRRRQQYL